jgi:hypothetical protein
MTKINLQETLRDHKEALAVFVIVLLAALALVAGQAGAQICLDPETRPGGGGSYPAPETYITNGPAEGSSTTSNSASFEFSSDDAQGYTFRCQLSKDGVVAQAWAACTSPKSYLNLTPGSYRFDVVAAGPIGVTDRTPASRNWTITSPGSGTPLRQLRQRVAYQRRGGFGLWHHPLSDKGSGRTRPLLGRSSPYKAAA